MRASPLLPLLLLLCACPKNQETGDTADGDGDGYPWSSDCDDQDGTVFPGADELCDGLDNDCDGTTDENAGGTYYADSDGDGYGDPLHESVACDPPPGSVEDATDCDDSDSRVNPGATEECDGVDNDCNGTVDEVSTTWYKDLDGDGYGDANVPRDDCSQPPGFVSDNTDCDDRDPDSYPGASEIRDSKDNDCDSEVDEDLAPATGFRDADGDGYGDDSDPIVDCDADPECVLGGGDCDDTTAEVNPGADEVCDGLDNDCDGEADGMYALDAAMWYEDADGDGYGNAQTPYGEACESPGTGYVSEGGDCDDSNARVTPETACNSFEPVYLGFAFGWGLKDGEIYDGYTLDGAELASQYRVILANEAYLTAEATDDDACALYFGTRWREGTLDPGAWQNWELHSTTLTGLTEQCAYLDINTWSTDPYEYLATMMWSTAEVSIEELTDADLISILEGWYPDDWASLSPYYFQGSFWFDEVDMGGGMATFAGNAYPADGRGELDVETMVPASEVAADADAYYWLPPLYFWSL